MAHFAEIDADNIVLRVLVVHDDYAHRGAEFLSDDMGLGGTWIQTSYNTYGNVHLGEDGEPDGGTPIGYNFAGIGYHYGSDDGAFYSPQKWPSWSLDENYVWQAPTPYPDDGDIYLWDEDTTSWIDGRSDSPPA
jgi:hypothetical protein